jgi:hypothetical protein
MRRSVLMLVSCVAATVAAPSPAPAGESGGTKPPTAVYAGVSVYRGGWHGTGSSCRWDPFMVDVDGNITGPSKTENGVHYDLWWKRCPGPTTETVWIPRIDHRRLSYQATDYLEKILPAPVAGFAPPAANGVVKVGMWFWVKSWSSVSVTAWVPTPSGPRWATTTARPVRLLLEPGDGRYGTGTMVCDGPGSVWSKPIGDTAPSPSGCEYTYRHSSVMAANRSTFPAAVTIVWDVSWKGSSGTGGYAGQLRTSRTYAMTVREIQAVVASERG